MSASAKIHYPRGFQENHFQRRGIITYYTPSNDACTGKSSSSSDMVAALAKPDFGGDYGGNTEKSPTCGRCVEVTGPKGSVVVKIVDMCSSCNSGHVDLSPAAFVKVAEKSAGKLEAQWKFVDCSASPSGGKGSKGESSPPAGGDESADSGSDYGTDTPSKGDKKDKEGKKDKKDKGDYDSGNDSGYESEGGDKDAPSKGDKKDKKNKDDYDSGNDNAYGSDNNDDKKQKPKGDKKKKKNSSKDGGKSDKKHDKKNGKKQKNDVVAYGDVPVY
ncbi:RlpA-like double-psi beta-barrel-protein domain-containing protein-containing protein [Syncephalis plumigaleata]|nr:RlpA-like double-psi beta-barrel-protein domain-containing protein-containing protein [Syncephalis plumigaleata]